jgi:hypothetical protein
MCRKDRKVAERRRYQDKSGTKLPDMNLPDMKREERLKSPQPRQGRERSRTGRGGEPSLTENGQERNLMAGPPSGMAEKHFPPCRSVTRLNAQGRASGEPPHGRPSDQHAFAGKARSQPRRGKRGTAVPASHKYRRRTSSPLMPDAPAARTADRQGPVKQALRPRLGPCPGPGPSASPGRASGPFTFTWSTT